eukprot:2133875-Ditylum_brightwellii.AAC.1
MDKDALLALKLHIQLEYDVNQGNKNRPVAYQLLKAKKVWRKIRNQSFKKRQEFLNELTSEEATRTGVSKASILQRIKNAEANKKMFYTIKRHLKGEQGVGLKYIEVLNQDIYWWLISIGLAE